MSKNKLLILYAFISTQFFIYLFLYFEKIDLGPEVLQGIDSYRYSKWLNVWSLFLFIGLPLRTIVFMWICSSKLRNVISRIVFFVCYIIFDFLGIFNVSQINSTGSYIYAESYISNRIFLAQIISIGIIYFTYNRNRYKI